MNAFFIKLRNAGVFAILVGSYAASASAEVSVRVECYGDCGRISLGQACDTVGPGSSPIALSCDDTQLLGREGHASRTCGVGDTCTPYGTLVRSDLLSAYCLDGPGMDAIVYCR